MKVAATLAFLLSVATTVVYGAEDVCAPGPITPREDVNYTLTEEFEINESSLELLNAAYPVQVDSTLGLAGSDIAFDIGVTPRALVPQYHNSTNYVWFTGKDGAGNDDPAATCGFQFEYDMDIESLPQLWDTVTVPIECLTLDLTTTASFPITFESDIEVWQCYDTPGSCSRVLPADVGFDALDPLSLFNEPLCKGPLVFKMTLTVNPGSLNETVSFALDYVRDEVTTTDPFFSVNGAQSLQNPVHWSICDEAESGFVDFADCLARMNAYGGAKRVLELSVPGEDAKEIDLVFGLTGSDQQLVDVNHELTISTAKSYAWLYHYPNNPLALDSTVSTCFTADGCTDVTSAAVLTPSSDVETGYYNMKLHAFMPDFDETYRCDEGYCVLVLRLNFLANNARRELAEYTTSLVYKDGSFSRMLQQDNSVPATQGMRIGLKNPVLPAGYEANNNMQQQSASSSSSGAIIIAAAIGCAALIVAGVVYKKKHADVKMETTEKATYVIDEPQTQITVV